MNKKQFEEIEEDIKDVSDDLSFIKTILIFLLIIIITTIIVFIILKIDLPPSKGDYCDYQFGKGYYYNRQTDEPYEVRSCDYLERNGDITQEFFSMFEYKVWRRTR